MMGKVLDKLEMYRNKNLEQKGITFLEEEFNELCEDVLIASMEHIRQLKIANGVGVVAGAAGVGLVYLSVKGIKKIKKNRSNKKQEKNKEQIDEVFEEAWTKAHDELEPFETDKTEQDIAKDDEIIKQSKEISDRVRKELESVITAINQHESSIRH